MLLALFEEEKFYTVLFFTYRRRYSRFAYSDFIKNLDIIGIRKEDGDKFRIDESVPPGIELAFVDKIGSPVMIFK